MADYNYPDLSKIWPEWKVVKKVGEGSFGKVYKCERDEYGINSVCAIKKISIPQSPSELESVKFEGFSEAAAKSYFEDIVKDFSNEIKMMLMLKGASNIVSVENYKIVEKKDTIGWDIYIRMEFLTSFIKFSAGLEFKEPSVKRFGLDLCNALEICSRKGIIHRDIKPDNIFVDDYGNYKIGDFGVAKRLEGTVGLMSKKGTYAYMAPEVFKDEPYDARADIYSLGMVMYKLLNRNRDPFISLEKQYVSLEERTESFNRRKSGEELPAPVDASPEMAKVILKACAFKAEDRYKDAKEFRKALQALDIDTELDTLFDEYKEKQMLEEIEPEQDKTVAEEKTTMLEGTEAVKFEVVNALKGSDIANYEESDDKSSDKKAEEESKNDIPIGKKEAPKKKKGKKTAVIIAAVLVVVAGVAAALVYGNGRWFNKAPVTAAQISDVETSESVEMAMAYLGILEDDFRSGNKTGVYVIEAIEKKGYLSYSDETVKEKASTLYSEAIEVAVADVEKAFAEGRSLDVLEMISKIPSNDDYADKLANYRIKSWQTLLEKVDVMIETSKQFDDIESFLDRMYACSMDDGEKAEIDARRQVLEMNKAKENQLVLTTQGVIGVDPVTNSKFADFTIINFSGKEIASVNFGVLEFDEQGAPVTVIQDNTDKTYVNERYGYINYTIPANGRLNTAQDNDFNLIIENNTTYAKVCVRSVTYADGTTWNNPYYPFWAEENNAAYAVTE